MSRPHRARLCFFDKSVTCLRSRPHRAHLCFFFDKSVTCLLSRPHRTHSCFFDKSVTCLRSRHHRAHSCFLISLWWVDWRLDCVMSWPCDMLTGSRIKQTDQTSCMFDSASSQLITRSTHDSVKSSVNSSQGQLMTQSSNQSTCHKVNSWHSQVVNQLITRSTHDSVKSSVNSSQGQLMTQSSRQSTHHKVNSWLSQVVNQLITRSTHDTVKSSVNSSHLNVVVVSCRLLVTAKGEVFVLLHVCLFVCSSTISQQPTGWFKPSFACGRILVPNVSSPLLVVSAPGGRQKDEMKFSLLWESMGNFCILAVLEQYLSNAWTHPHQILFV